MHSSMTHASSRQLLDLRMQPLILNSGAKSAATTATENLSARLGEQTLFNLQQLLLSNIWVKVRSL
jgi:hypothetical protein